MLRPAIASVALAAAMIVPAQADRMIGGEMVRRGQASVAAMSEPNSRLSAALKKSLETGDKQPFNAELVSYRAAVEKQLELFPRSEFMPSDELRELRDGIREYLVWQRDTSTARAQEAFEKGSAEPPGSERQHAIVSGILTPLAEEEAAFFKRLDLLGATAYRAAVVQQPSRDPEVRGTAMYDLGGQLVTILFGVVVLVFVVMRMVKKAKSDPRARAMRAARRESRRGGQFPNDPY